MPDALAPELLDLVYGAALGRNTWQDILAALEREFPGVRFALWGHDLSAHRDPRSADARADFDFMECWIRCTTGARQAEFSGAPIGALKFAERLLPKEDIPAESGSGEEILPEDMLTGIGLTMYGDADRFFALSTNVRARDEDLRGLAVGRLLRELGPHLARSFALTRIIQQSIGLREFEAAFEVIGVGALLLDGRGRVLTDNPAARRVLGEHTAVFLDTLGHLRFASALAQRQFERLLLKVGHGDRFRLPDTIVAEDEGRQSHLRLRMVPFRSPSLEPDPAVAFTAPDRPVILVCLEIEEPEPEQRAARLLMQRHRLSRIECELALALCRGEQLSAVAGRREVSIHTVRNQLRSIFLKTGAGSQSRLVALVWRLATEPVGH